MTGNRLILGLRACTCLGLLASVPPLAGAVAQESPTLRRVMLSTAGIGFFDFEAKADAEGSVRLTVPLPQVDDILKSLTVYAAQGTVLGLTLPGPAPLADLFRNAPVQEGDLSSLPALLEALRGIEVTVGGPSALTGRVLSVTREELPAKEGSPVPARHRVALLTATGLRSFVLEDAQALELSDTALQRRLDDLLSRLAEARREQQRELTLRTGQAEGAVTRFGYLAEAPVWKAAYRVLAGPEDSLVQGWAVLENMSGHDWREVELTLVAGSPRALRQALYQSYFVDRAEVPVMATAALEDAAPKRFERSLAMAAPSLAAPFAAEAAPPPPRLVAAEQEELTAQTLYRLPQPASVGIGQSLMAPLVDARFPTQRLALVTSEQQGDHPRAALRLTNAGTASLPPGLVTVYEPLEGGALSFAGDATLDALAPGGSQDIPFAVDGKLALHRSELSPRRVSSLRAVDGVLELRLARQAVTSLELRLDDDAPRRLVVDWQRPDGWRVVEPADASLTPGRLRFERELRGRDTRIERLVLEREEQRRFQLDSVPIDEILAWTEGGELPAPLRTAFGRLGELAQALSEAEAEAARLEAERARLVTDQERLRANLESVPGESDLGRQYVQRLAGSERQIDTLDQALSRARDEVEAAAARRREFIRQLAL